MNNRKRPFIIEYGPKGIGKVEIKGVHSLDVGSQFIIQFPKQKMFSIKEKYNAN